MAVLQFPLAGLDRRFAYQNQRPFTTPRALNVFPMGGLDQRERGGSRPGCDAAFYETLGSGNKINMMGDVTLFGADGLNIWEDTFEGADIGDAWMSMTGFSEPFSTTRFAGFASIRADRAGAMIRRPFNISDAADRGIEMFIKPHKGVHCGTYRLHLQLHNTIPNYATNGYTFEIVFSANGSYTWSVFKREASTLTTLGSGSVSSSSAAPGWMKFQLREMGAGGGSRRVWASFRSAVHYNTEDVFNNGAGDGVFAGSGAGISVTGTGTSSQRCLIDTVRIRRYLSSTSQSRNRILIAAANGSVYRETPMGTLEAKINGSYSGINLASDRNLSCSAYLQKLYIADTSEVVCKATDGSISTATVTSATIGSWISAGVDVKNHLFVMKSCSDPTVILGAWKIASISGGGNTNLNLDPSYYPGTSGTVGGITFEVVRGPKVYTPSVETTMVTSADALELWVCEANKGTIPPRCEIVATFLERMILAAPADNPHQVFFSRAGKPRDFRTGGLPSDTSQAVALAMAQPVKAVIPFGNDYCVIGMTDKIAKLIGDPGYGGQLRYISNSVGMVGKQAFCHGPGGELYFMSRDGLYVLPPGADGEPTPLSRERLPVELLHIDSQIYSVQLGYSRAFRGVNIWLTHDPMGENAGTSYSARRYHYFFSIATGSFWPVQVPTTYEPTASCQYEGHSDEDSGLLLGGRDGIVRKLSQRFDLDGDTAIDSYVVLGPAPLSSPGRVGMLRRMRAMLGEESDSVELRVYSGTTPQEAVDNATQGGGTTLRYSATAGAGASLWFDPRVTDLTYLVQIIGGTNTPNYAWEIENILCDLADVGPARDT